MVRSLPFFPLFFFLILLHITRDPSFLPSIHPLHLSSHLSLTLSLSLSLSLSLHSTPANTEPKIPSNHRFGWTNGMFGQMILDLEARWPDLLAESYH